MEIEFIYRTIKISAVLAAVGFLVVSQAFGLSVGWGFLVGAVWNCLNLWALAVLVRNAFTKPPKKKRILALFLLKFPVLYGGGILLVLYGGVDIIGVLVGFSLPLMVMVLKGGGRALQQRDEVAPQDEAEGR